MIVTERRTKEDRGCLRIRLTGEFFPDAQRIHWMCDHLSTHALGALYRILPPAEARKRARRFCLHPTPRHASWLNMAEIEISALERQGLDRRIPDVETLQQEAAAWVELRNTAQVRIHRRH